MSQHDRHKSILRILSEHEAVGVAQLAGLLGASVATVRRDLTLLETAQQLRRSHGHAHRHGADDGPALRSTSFGSEVRSNMARKRAIARKAVALCADSDTVLIGGGTTTFQMVEFMTARRMRVLTNSFAIARGLIAASDNEVSLTGGKVYREAGVILSPFEAQAVQYWHADHLFMGVYCLSALGLMEADPLLIQAGQRLMPQAQQVTVLADSSKFGSRGGMFLCALERISRVITDTDAPDAAVQMLERAGVEVVLAAPEDIARPSPAGMQPLSIC